MNDNNDNQKGSPEISLPPEVLQQLQMYQEQLNPRVVAITVTMIKSNGATEIQSFYNPNGLYITISDEAPQQGNGEETTETTD